MRSGSEGTPATRERGAVDEPERVRVTDGRVVVGFLALFAAVVLLLFLLRFLLF